MEPDYTTPIDPDDVETLINAVVDEIRDLLIEKNRRYGNSALDPVRIFSSADTREQIFVRIDDKLSRIRTQHPNDREDPTFDLLGYLILLRVWERFNA